MDKLYEIAEFYKKELDRRKFHLVAGKKGKIIEFDIRFGVEHFKHLFGLHKLIDIPSMRDNSRSIYQGILRGNIVYGDIQKSKHFDTIVERLNNFRVLKGILNTKELLIRALYGTFNKIIADFMLTDKDSENKFIHLFLKEVEPGYTTPVTFIVNSNNKYLQNNPNRWTILSINEVV